MTNAFTPVSPFSPALISSLESADSNRLCMYDWPLQTTAITKRGTVLLVHGLGEHMGRYAHVAAHLNNWGFDVRGYDQFGHGQSSGARGGLPSDDRLLDDLLLVLTQTQAKMPANFPLILLGHSMGGSVVGRFVSLNLGHVDALVMSSPALDPGLNVIQKLLLATLPAIAPNLRINNGLDAQLICHDPAVVKAYLADPLDHDRISARLAKFIATAGPATVALAPQWTTPTLLMFAGQDKLVNPAGSRAFAASTPDCVATQCFEHMYHEILNEPDQALVFTCLQAWLDRQFPV